MTADRHLRADARRNRRRVLDAADAVFAAKGISASTDEIARAAGVGIGTVFRHFPTKEALLEAVLIARIQALVEEADSLRTAIDPGAAFFGFLTRMVRRSVTKNIFVEALAAAGVEVESAIVQDGQDLLQIIGTLLSRAQQAGAVRSDVQTPELVAVIVGASRAVEHVAGDPDLPARTLALILDGLRPRH